MGNSPAWNPAAALARWGEGGAKSSRWVQCPASQRGLGGVTCAGLLWGTRTCWAAPGALGALGHLASAFGGAAHGKYLSAVLCVERRGEEVWLSSDRGSQQGDNWRSPSPGVQQCPTQSAVTGELGEQTATAAAGGGGEAARRPPVRGGPPSEGRAPGALGLPVSPEVCTSHTACPSSHTWAMCGYSQDWMRSY